MKRLKQYLLAFAMALAGTASFAQTCNTTSGVTTCAYNIPDDGYAIVPIPFGFPFYGRIFTHSLFFDNGLVSFYSPTDPMRLGGQNFNAQPLSNNIGTNFYYSIMPLWSDLVNTSGSHTTQTDGLGYLRYNWNNVSQWGHPSRLNSFSLEIQPTGFIGINYQQININGYPITSGMVGNAALGEWQQQYYKPPQGTATTGSTSSWSVNETYGADCSNPLNNANCPGYAQALFTQQCTNNALHSPACPGYAQAMFTQQCTNNTLFNVNCPGYAQAYLTYQCSLSALYSTACPGYEQAYFNQQCSLNPLYSITCPGYADAYYVQQCTLSPLYDSGCTGYAEAYFSQQCSLSALYDTTCPGYAEAYFSQQCSLNGLYDRQCPNYSTAYATQQLLSPPRQVEAVVTPVVIAPEPSSTPISASSPGDPVEIVAQAPAAAELTTTTQAAPAPAPAPAAERPAGPPTTRQALAERRMAAARQAAVERAQNVQSELDTASSLEAQVEVQNVLIQAMGFTPGFEAYTIVMPDGVGYKPFTIYNNQSNVDNARVQRGLTARSDALHQQMVDSQYNRRTE